MQQHPVEACSRFCGYWQVVEGFVELGKMNDDGLAEGGLVGGVVLECQHEGLVVLHPPQQLIAVAAVRFVEQDRKIVLLEPVLDGFCMGGGLTGKEEIAEEDVGVLAALRIDDIDHFDRHQRGDRLCEDQGRARPSEHLYLARDIHHENVLLAPAFLCLLCHGIHDPFWLRCEQVERGEDGAIRAQFVVLHHLHPKTSTFL